jgi:hypothetical protein
MKFIENKAVMSKSRIIGKLQMIFVQDQSFSPEQQMTLGYPDPGKRMSYNAKNS